MLTGLFGLVLVTIAVAIVRGVILGRDDKLVGLNIPWILFWFGMEFLVGKQYLLGGTMICIAGCGRDELGHILYSVRNCPSGLCAPNVAYLGT